MNKDLRDNRNKRRWRPKKAQLEQIEHLFSIGCTKKEIYSLMQITSTTFNRWCEDNEELVNEYKNKVKESLRKAMLKNAIENDNTQMQIHLSKHYLGMTDKLETKNTNIEIPVINIIENEEEK